ncbi:MAG: hypothetical protein Q8P15_02520 [Nanoarchaeota archaeon]|nr:hypothetical protein [Nanoarchaeota archaeon]
MLEIYKLFIGVLFLMLGFSIGNYLASITKDERKQGQKWFRLIIIASLIGGLISLIARNDVLLFTFFFIAIVTSRSLKK